MTVVKEKFLLLLDYYFCLTCLRWMGRESTWQAPAPNCKSDGMF